MATWQLASNAMTGSDALRVEPVSQHDGLHVDAISDHSIGNVGQARTSEKADTTIYSPMIFKTTRFGLRPSHSP